MPYDYNEPPSTLIPEGTVATLALHIEPGGVGEDHMLTRSKLGDCEMLKLTFTVVDGPHKGRKFLENWILEGTTDGHATARGISLNKLKAVLDSAFGLDPDDRKSQQARTARGVTLKQLEGLMFMARIGVVPPKDGYDEKNVVEKVLTRKQKEWHAIEQTPPFNGGGAAAPASAPSQPAAPPISRPGWAS